MGLLVQQSFFFLHGHGHGHSQGRSSSHLERPFPCGKIDKKTNFQISKIKKPKEKEKKGFLMQGAKVPKIWILRIGSLGPAGATSLYRPKLGSFHVGRVRVFGFYQVYKRSGIHNWGQCLVWRRTFHVGQVRFRFWVSIKSTSGREYTIRSMSLVNAYLSCRCVRFGFGFGFGFGFWVLGFYRVCKWPRIHGGVNVLCECVPLEQRACSLSLEFLPPPDTHKL